MKSLRSPLSQARGLGSAGTGTAHFFGQRITAVALIPLALWFLISVLGMMHGNYATITAWVATPWVSVMLILFIAVLFYHSQLGLQMVIEDYVHHEGARLVTLLLVRFANVVLAALGIIAVLRVAFGG